MGTLRIVVNDIAASSGGALSVLEDFYKKIIENNDENEWIFLLNDFYFEETNNIQIIKYSNLKKSWIKRLLFDLITGKHKVNKLNPDLYVSLQNTSTLGLRCPQIVYLHQGIPYQEDVNFSFFNRKERKLAIYQKVIGRIYNFLFKYSKAQIVVQTKWMKSALKRYVDNDIKIISPNVEITHDIEYAHKGNNFFYPASNIPYKNHNLIFESVNKLVKNGIEDFSVSLTICPTEVKNKDKYKFLGKISRERVYDLYKETVLLFPSYIETFGLPLLEAKESNSIILASDTIFSKEILGNYPNAYYFDFKNVDELYDLMKKSINGEVKYISYLKSDLSSDNDLCLYNYIVNFYK